jgi:hypothetical protein
MPFLRRWAPEARTLRAIALATACAITLAGIAVPSPAHAHPRLDATPRLVDDVVPARTPVAIPTTDATLFCPRPTGRWWEDVTVRGCVQLLIGRDHTTPISAVELTWLDLGDLPAFATVDLDELETFLTALEQRIADEAEAAERAAAAAKAQPRPVAQRAPRELPGQPYSNATIDRVLTECGYHDTTPRSLEEQDAHRVRADRCIDERMPGYWDWVRAADRKRAGIEVDPEQEAYEACLQRLGPMTSIDQAATRAYFDAHARCVDQQIPGYYARWVQAEEDRDRRFREAEARAAADADAYNPGIIAAAAAELAAGADSITVGLYGGSQRVIADTRTIGEACFTRSDANSYSSWIQGDSGWTPGHRATVRCVWIAR